MSVRYMSTADAPEAIGPYSQATVVGGFLFTAGQVAFDPKTMQVVEGFAADENARIGAALERRERLGKIARAHFGRTARAARELREANDVFSCGARHREMLSRLSRRIRFRRARRAGVR